jgi:hypothetical protein
MDDGLYNGCLIFLLKSVILHLSLAIHLPGHVICFNMQKKLWHELG